MGDVTLITLVLLLTIFLGSSCFSDVDHFSSTRPAETIRFALRDHVFQDITNPEVYNKRQRPREGMPIEVKCRILLQSISSKNDEMRRENEMAVMLRCAWSDSRLTFPGDATIVGNQWHVDRIWTPPLYSCQHSDTLTLHISPNGRVLHVQRAQMYLMCEMDYEYYPMDTQTCSLVIESGMYTKNDLILRWLNDGGVQLSDQLHFPGFELLEHHIEEATVAYPEAGNFSRLLVTFVIQRHLHHFLLEIYIPSMLFVVTSWISFWLDIQAAPARIAVCLTSMLTLVTSTKSIREKIPPLSYFHALDIWNFACIAFVFCSMLQYAVVNFIYTNEKRQKSWKRRDSVTSLTSVKSVISLNDFFSKALQEQKRDDVQLPASSPPSITPRRRNSQTSLASVEAGRACTFFTLTPQDVANSIDKKCRVLFPAAFLIFNIFYWIHIYL